MKQKYTRRKLMMAGVVAAASAIAGSSASAQTATTTSTTSTTAGVLTTASKSPPGTATPDMIKEAIQRSQARTENLRKLGTPEQWGSEEPFTFSPTK
jgi:hypothetical protein